MGIRFLSWRRLAVFALVLIYSGRALAQTATIPTTDQMRQLYDAGQYHECLQVISKLLLLRGAAGTQVDRPKMLLLRGDCLVKLQDARAAQKAYKDAESAAKDDPDTALRARAGTVILQNCRGISYMPPGTQPIDVSTNDGWKQAATAIFNSTWQNSQNAFAAAQSAQDLAPIYPVVPTITNLVALSRVADIDTSQLAPTVMSIGQRARDIITRVLNQQDETISLAQQNSSMVISTTISTGWAYQWTPTIRAGLSTPDRDALSNVVDTANEAFNLASQGKEAAILLSGVPEKWQAVMDHAADVGQHAQRVLDAE